MPVPARHHHHTLDEYFAREARSPDKSEYDDGAILAMAGGSARHNLISMNAGVALATGARGTGCRALSPDQRLATPDGLYTYADATLVCGPLALGREQTLLNPTVVVEVLSPATQEYDRGEKLARYRSIPSLQHVLLIEPDHVDVEHWRRDAAGWSRTVYTSPEDRIALEPPGLVLSVRDLYEGADAVPG
jgi:Uma2 family endonuclease